MTPPPRERRSRQPSQSPSETGAITVPLRSVQTTQLEPNPTAITAPSCPVQNTQPESDSTDIAVVIRAVIGPVMSRLEALERLSMPPPPPSPCQAPLMTVVTGSLEQTRNNSRLTQNQNPSPSVPALTPQPTGNPAEEDWTA